MKFKLEMVEDVYEDSPPAKVSLEFETEQLDSLRERLDQFIIACGFVVLSDTALSYEEMA